MLFDKNDNRTNERVLYETKPNMLLGCKKAIYGFILLAIILMLAPMAIQFIGEMQVYLISYVKLSLTRYAAIGLFVIILVIILYIIWQLIGWYSLEYTLTDTKIVIKSGVLSTKRNYMPYSTIQDINTSQSIFAKLLNVGTISVYSAYDNNQMELANISNPSKVEEVIFSNMMGYRNFQQQPQQRFADVRQNQPGNTFNPNNYVERNDYYDDFEPITPIGHERNDYPRRDYEYYPENLNFEEEAHTRYEYEPYDDNYGQINPGPIERNDNNIQFEGAPNSYSDESYYSEVRDDYSYGDDDFYQNNGSEMQYSDDVKETSHIESEDVDDSSEKVIRRHFDKFKR